MKKTIKNLMLLSAALLLNNFCANAQWVLTGNPTATNTSILGATGANINLRIFAGGAAAANERIRIVGSNGNVGIGTTAPTNKLHVVGTSRLQGVTTIVGATTITGAATISGLTTTGTLKVTGGAPGLNKILRSDAAGLASWITNPVGTNTLNKIPTWNGTQLVAGTIFDNGNIGIGNTSPANKLSVTGNANITGNLGIGITTPVFPLDIQAASCFAQIKGSGGSAGLVLDKFNVADNEYLIHRQGGIDKWVEGSVGDNNFCIRNWPLGTNAITIDAANNFLGVGTTTPGSKLSVVGDAAATSPVVQVTNSYVGSSDVRGVASYSKAADGWGYGIEATGGYRGGYLVADAGAYSGSGIGVYGYATGSAGDRYGVYGYAFNSGGEAWGGYFPTKTYTNELRVGGTQGATGYVAAINGKLIATEVRVALQSSWPDYVFNNNYQLMDIHQLEQSIKAVNHLPGMPSACEVEENGLHLGEMQTKIVEKLEESHLYIIQLQKQIDELKAQVNELKK